jgi:hypothetical protein
VKKCIEANKNGEDIEDNFQKLRTQIHLMDCSSQFAFVAKEKVMVKKSKVLEPGGIAEIFDGEHSDIFPFDIVS